MNKELLGVKDELEQIEKDKDRGLFMEEVMQYTIRTVYGKVDTSFDLGMLSMISGISNYSLEKAKEIAMNEGKDMIYLPDVKKVIDEVASYHKKTLSEIQLQDRFRKSSDVDYNKFFDKESRKLLDKIDCDVEKMDEQDNRAIYAFSMAKKELGEEATNDMIAERSMQILAEIKDVSPEYFTKK